MLALKQYVCGYSVNDMIYEYDNPIDVCFEMVCQLLENKTITYESDS